MTISPSFILSPILLQIWLPTRSLPVYIPVVSREIAVIVCNGEPISPHKLADLCDEAGIVIAADAGLLHLMSISVKPDLFVGDRDSLPLDIDPGEESSSQRIFDPHKDSSDTELAIQAALELGADRIVLTCATGRRIDHLYANLSLLVANPGAVFIYDGETAGFALSPAEGTAKISAAPGTIFSVLPFGEDCSGVTISGAKWNLVGGNLKVGSVGLSNQSVLDKIGLSLKTGKILIFSQVEPCNISIASRSDSIE